MFQARSAGDYDAVRWPRKLLAGHGAPSLGWPPASAAPWR